MNSIGQGRRACLQLLITALSLTALTLPSLGAAAAVAPGKIVVSGASGKLGGEVLDFLIQRGVKPQDLILITRSPEKLQSWAARGAAVRKGDFDDPATLPAAFAGGRRLLLISSGELGAKLFPQNQAAIAAARRAGIRYIVYTSFVNAQKLAERGILPGHYPTEVALRDSGLAWTVLRNQDYMENTTDRARNIVAAGVYVSDFGDGSAGSVAHIDCAEAAAAALTTSGHEGKVYDITGPELLSSKDVARTLSEVTGRPVRVEARAARAGGPGGPPAGPPAGGPSAEQLAFFAGLAKAQRDGLMAVRSDDFQKLTGHAPHSLRSVLEAEREALLR